MSGLYTGSREEIVGVSREVVTRVSPIVPLSLSFNSYIPCKSERQGVRDDNGLDTGSCLACISISRGGVGVKAEIFTS